jgi:hypothetical protein
VASTFTPAGLLRDGVPVYPVPDWNAGIVDLPAAQGVSTWPTPYVRGYIQNWNFTMQKQLKGGFVGQVGYVASRQVKQAGSRQLNIGTLGGGRASQPYFQKFGDFSSISMQMGRARRITTPCRLRLNAGSPAATRCMQRTPVQGDCVVAMGLRDQLWEYRTGRPSRLTDA